MTGLLCERQDVSSRNTSVGSLPSSKKVGHFTFQPVDGEKDRSFEYIKDRGAVEILFRDDRTPNPFRDESYTLVKDHYA